MIPSIRYPRTIHKLSVHSAILSEERGITVYLPPDYDERLRYPMLYCQDGEDFFLFGRIATIASWLIVEEKLEPFLIAGVHVDKTRRNAEYAPTGDRFAPYMQFFAEELVPFLERQYPIRPEPFERIVAGDSLGGTVSLHLALRYPALFRRVLALSGAFFADTREAVRQAGLLDRLELYQLVGTEETATETSLGTIDFLHENRATRAVLERQKARLLYQEKPGRHLWGFWQQELPNALRHFFG